MINKIVKGSLDRFEAISNDSKYAIIYSDNDPSEKYDVPIELLSKNHIIKKEGIRVKIYLDENDKIVGLEYDKENTQKSKKRIQNKLNKLLSGKHLDVDKKSV